MEDLKKKYFDITSDTVKLYLNEVLRTWLKLQTKENSGLYVTYPINFTSSQGGNS